MRDRTMTRILLGVAICLGAVLALGRGSWADIVYLKNKTVVRGEIVASDEKTVTLKVDYGKVVIDRAQIDRIEKEDDLKVLLAEARRLEMSGDETRAESKYSEILKRFPDSETARSALAKLLHRRAKMLLMAQKVAEAEPVLRRLAELDPADSFAKDELKHIDEVRGNAGALEKEAVLLARIGRGREALEKFDELTSVLPEAAARDAKFIAQAHVSEGDQLLPIDLFREAGKHYEEAVQADPTLAEKLVKRRLVSILEPIARERKQLKDELPRQRWEQFAGELEAAGKIDPDNILPPYYLGEVYVKLGRLREAGECFGRICGKTMDPANPGPSLQQLYNLAGDKVRQTKLVVTWDDTPWKEVSRNMQVIETPHFNIYSYNRELAELTGETAEYFYARVYRELAGQAPAAGWPRKCAIYLYASHEEYLKESGQETWSEANARTVSSEGELKDLRIMTFQGVRNLLSSHIPHELTHIIQSAMFGYTTRISTWLKEGLAVHNEPWFKRRFLAEVLQQDQQTQKGFTLQELTAQRGYPAEARVRIFYAESLGLVETLIALKDMETFNRFTQLSTTKPFAEAVKETYGLSMQDVERAWSQQMDTMRKSVKPQPE